MEIFGLFGRAPTTIAAPPKDMAAGSGAGTNAPSHLGMPIIFPVKERGTKDYYL